MPTLSCFLSTIRGGGSAPGSESVVPDPLIMHGRLAAAEAWLTRLSPYRPRWSGLRRIVEELAKLGQAGAGHRLVEEVLEPVEG